MKLVKYISTVTIATAIASSAAAETKVYGSLRLALQDLDTDGGTTDSLDIEDRLSRIGVKGSSKLNNGLTIFGQIEYGLSAGGEFTQGEDLGLRLATVGFKGDFGKVSIGSQTPLWHKMVRGAYFSDGNDSLRHGTIRDDDLVQYMGKNGGFSYGAEVSFEAEDDEDINHYTAGASYGNKKFKLQAAVLKDNLGDNTGTLTGIRAWAYLGPVTLSAFHHNSPDDFDLYGVGGGYASASTGACAGEDRDTTGIYGRYKTGSNQFHARFATLDCDSDSAEESIKLEYVKFLSKKTRIWLAYEEISSEGTVAEPTIAEIGLRHDF
ncbi:MAG: porin [Cellvibrionaceae bacterium]